MSEGLFSAVELADASRAGYRLHHLEVFNWGTFDQRVWRFTADGDTALLTGDIGSGKSTLVDAVTTLLMPSHRISYNKAAGAESKERTLRSYVEGHYKSERLESSGVSRAIGLRQDGATYSVILGVFTNGGYDETITLAQVFQQRERAGQPYRFYVTAPKALEIAGDFADFGTDLRDLRRRLRAGGAEVFDDFPKYSTALRRLLGIRSEQALELFHQTVSMKSVGNLNEFVRDHMLEPADATGRVRDIIAHFDDLTRAHDAVKRAREQLEALTPIVALADRYDETWDERAKTERQRDAVRQFVAELRLELLTAEIEALKEETDRLQVEQDDARRSQAALSHERDALIAERAQAGGDRISELERVAREARALAEERQVRRVDFDQAVTAAGQAPIDNAAGFTALRTTVASARPDLAEVKRTLDAEYAEQLGRARDLQTRAAGIEQELESLRQRTDNLPPEYVELRAALCADLGLSTAELPYAGEMLDVADEHAAWRGAAERVLRGFALSLLVPQEHYDAVSAWVDGRRLQVRGSHGRLVGARLTYERVAARRVPLQRDHHEGLVLADCLEVKDGPFADYLRAELIKRADHRCAVDLAEFRAHRRAVTLHGQVRSGERHVKDDRHPVDDPRRWVLGWANERKVTALQDELVQVAEQRAVVDEDVARVQDRRDEVQRRGDAFARLDAYRSWSDVDVASAHSRAATADAERARLTAGSDRLQEIAEALQANEDATKEVGDTLERLTGALARWQAERQRKAGERDRDQQEVGSRPETERDAARSAYPALRERLGRAVPTRSEDCGQAADRLSEELHRRVERLGGELNGLALNLTKLMNDIVRRWPEAGVDMDASVEARSDFRTFHERVATDDLPRFEQEFKRQLNTNTIRELAQFSNWLRRQAEEIDVRVGRINDALGAIPYNPGRYIRLEKQPTPNQDVAAFRAELRAATDDTLVGDDDQYSEQRFLDVKRIIDRFRGREGYSDADRAWTRRVTDVRNWFVFSASERDLESDEEWEHYSDSDGKSGGQKEKLAYTILAASLAYQFGLEWGARTSRDFRFAVIDEAFGRGSDVSTRYALELFAKLGLQLLIVTPLQKVHVIEPYVRSIGYVDNPGGTASRLQTMTIEEYHARRDRHRAAPGAPTR